MLNCSIATNNGTITFLAACRAVEFVHTLTNRALQGHVLKTVQTSDFDACQLKCYLKDDCVSINFSSNGKCDLSSLDHTQRPDDLIEEAGTVYSSIEVSGTFNFLPA